MRVLKNNRNYWKEFYKNKHINLPSDFANYTVNSIDFLTENVSIVDIGCGNCRDSKLLAAYSTDVTAVDYSAWNPSGEYKFIQSDIEDYIKKPCKHDIVYSRFFFHSISDKLIDKILRWTKEGLFAEFRVKGDKPILYTKHKRNFIDSNKFLQKLLELNYEILAFHVGRGLAKYKSEDPLVCRVIARKRKK